MDDTKKAYQQVSGVDIEVQKRIWDERGKGYYGEFLVFSHLFGEIPGMSKILMNCEIPAEGSKTTEVDLILIHDTGIYSFEMKHYKGDIYVNPDGETWTQYFRTQSNEVFHNPIKQNAYHIAAIKKLFPGVPVFSFVVFTNDECILRINGSICDYYCFDNGELCTMQYLPERFRIFSSDKENVLSAEKIDSAFNKLKPYSKIKNVAVERDGEPVSILEYLSQFNQAFKEKVQGTIDEYKRRKEELEEENRRTIKSSKRKVVTATAISVAACCISIVGILFLPQTRIKLAEKKANDSIAAVEQKYQSFFQMFDDAKTIVSDSVRVSDLIQVTDLSIRPAVGLDDSTVVSFTLNAIDGDIVLGFTGDTRMIVKLNNGEVKECDFYYDSPGQTGCILRNSAWLYKFGHEGFKTVPMENIMVTGVNYLEIDSIKLNNIAVFEAWYSTESVLNGIDIEVYKAQSFSG